MTTFFGLESLFIALDKKAINGFITTTDKDISCRLELTKEFNESRKNFDKISSIGFEISSEEMEAKPVMDLYFCLKREAVFEVFCILLIKSNKLRRNSLKYLRNNFLSNLKVAKID